MTSLKYIWSTFLVSGDTCAKRLGQDSVQLAEVLNVFKVLQGTWLYPWFISGTCISRTDLPELYNTGGNYMPDLGRLNPSQYTLGICTILIKIFSPGSDAQGEGQNYHNMHSEVNLKNRRLFCVAQKYCSLLTLQSSRFFVLLKSLSKCCISFKQQ